MKKIIITRTIYLNIWILLGLLLISGCGDNKNDETESRENGTITFAGYGKYRANNKVKVVKYEPLIGEDYFEWTYYPLPKQLPNYKYTSKAVGIEFDSMKSFAATAMQIHTMCLYDENLNIIF